MALYIGNNGDDTLTGTSGDDTLTGGGGNDTLIGGLGNDIAIFSSNKSGYEFSAGSAGHILVKDINLADGDDGTDTLSTIQIARFADGDVKTSYTGGEFRVNAYVTDWQDSPTITVLADGGFVVSWASQGQDGSGWGIYAQRYNADSTVRGGEFRVNTTVISDQSSNTIAALEDGGFVVSWQSDGQDGDGDGIYAQRYNADGTVQGGEFRVNTTVISDQSSNTIAVLEDGGFVVSWQSLGQDSSGWGIYAQRYNADGTVRGGEFRVNTTVISDQSSNTIAALADGGFVASWQSLDQDSSGWGIYAQRYNADGTVQGGEFRVNSTVISDQSSNTIAVLADGGFVVSWQSLGQDGSGWGIYAQRYNADGTVQGGEFRVNTTVISDQSSNTIAALEDGGFVASWQSSDQDGSDYGIYAQRYDADGNPLGNLKLEGSSAADQLKVATTMMSPVNLLGLDGQDVLQGGSGNDTLDGGAGNDSLNGGTGADSMIGGLGNDSYTVDNTGDVVTENSGEGTDTVSSNVTYTLSANVENLTLTGTSAINGTGNGLANILTGNSANNQLNGGAGNDTLSGGGGSDLLKGGGNNDKLMGGAGNDTLDGGTNTNTLTGGGGKDIFKFTTADHIDTITDFTVVDDTIQLENSVFTSLATTGVLAVAQFIIGTQALDANDFIIYNNATGALLYDADGSGAGAAAQIATVGIGLAMTNADIVVI